MRQLAFTVQKGGIDRQRIKGNARADTAYDLVNGYVSNAGTVVNRDGTLRDAILPATTRGLVGFEDLLHTFSYQLEQYTPVGYLANVLAHPTDETATLTEIHFAAPFMGALYVVAEWSDGGVFHYWLASSGEWQADTVYLEGDVVTPTEPNGLLYKAVANNPIVAGMQTWQPLTNYELGHTVLPTTYNGYYFEVTSTQGDVPISGAIEPDWSTTLDTTENVNGTGAPASNTGAGAASLVPPPIQDRYGTGGTDLSAAAQEAVNLSDSVARWSAGTLYQPGALVKPLSAAPVINSAIPNAGFESGDVNWTKGDGWHITNAGTGADGNKPYQGTWFAKWLAAESTGPDLNYLEMATKVPVIAGQFLSASCYESRDADETNSRLVLLWYDAYDVLVKETVGSTSESNNKKDYRIFTVQDSTPGGAVKVSVAFSAQRQFGLGEGQICVDSFGWDYVNLTPAEADFTIYQAVQADAATSGTSEPTWPGAGNTVVDGGVTWLGGVTSVITWTARPIMKSGSTEPARWNESPSYTHPGATADNTITWQTTTGYIPEAPNSKYVVLAAKKVFAGDDDIVKYSATVNPIDWTTAQDAGYLPTGLNTYGANPVRALGLYRGNLIPFNSAGFQMWQVDPDPELMQLLDAEPIGSTYHKALQAVKNDLIFLTQLGYRSLSIAGGASNLEANDIGNPIDVLVQAKLREGTYTPNSLYYPARGQYWGWFGPDVFVCTFNDAGRSWSRYEFPEALTDATLLNNDLFLRTATHKVWKVSADTLVDDYVFVVPDIGPFNITVGTSVSQFDLFGYSRVYGFGTLNSSGGDLAPGENVTTFDRPHKSFIQIIKGAFVFDWGQMQQKYESITLGDLGTFDLADCILEEDDFLAIALAAPAGADWIVASVQDITYNLNPAYVDPGGNIPFEGTLWWPALDLGNMGTNKQLDCFDLVCNGEVAVQFGYDQRDPTVLTDPYTLDGDTLPGTSIPFPLTAPSFAPKLTFSGSQRWEWMGLNLYIQDSRSSGFAG